MSQPRGGSGSGSGSGAGNDERKGDDAWLDRMGPEAAAFRRARVRQLVGHSKKVHSVAWNCSGSTLASGSLDATARLWSVDSTGHGKEAGTLRDHRDSVDQLCWHPTNSHALATASADKTVRVWDSRSNKCVSTIDTPGENINIEWSPNGQLLAVGNKEECVCLIDVRKGKVLRKIRFRCEVNEMAWHPSGELLLLTTGHKAAVVDEGIVEVMRLKNNALESVHKIKAHTANAYCIEFDRSGKYFATGGGDGLVCVFDTAELACVRSFDRLENPLRSVSFSFDGKYVACGSVDPFVAVQHVESGARVRAIPCGQATNTVAWHPRHYVLAYANDDPSGMGASTRDRGVVNVVGVPAP